MASVATGIDPGTRAVRVLQGKRKGSAFVPTRFIKYEHSQAPASALAALFREYKISAKGARIGLTGRDTILRFSQVPRLTDVQLRNLMKFEIDELAQQAGGNLASDFNLLPIPPSLTGDDTVLVALARNEALEATVTALAGTSASVGSFTPNAVALYDAFLKLGSVGEDGVLIANIGDENTDVAIVLGPDLAFARNLSGGGKLFTDAIAQRMNCDITEAEEMKHSSVNLAPNAQHRYKSPQEERVTKALLGPAGQFASLLQSTAALAKAQLKIPDLRISRVLLCGGGSRLLGFGEYLAASTGWNVSFFDPLESLDLASMPTEERAALEQDRYESVVAIGLALASSEKGLYRLDILPAAIAKKRRFYEKTSWIIAAGTLATAYLGAELLIGKALASDAREIATAEAREMKKRSDVHEKTVKLVGDAGREIKGKNSEQAELATELELRAAAGPSLVIFDRALRSILPPDFWITKFELRMDKDPRPQLGAAETRRPILYIKGRGRQDVQKINESFGAFTTKISELLRAEPIQNPSISKSGSGFEFELFMNLVPVSRPAPAADGAESDPAKK
ncbi:MAG: pilus assembly protein PilM [Planctomycetota bacterium]